MHRHLMNKLRLLLGCTILIFIMGCSKEPILEWNTNNYSGTYKNIVFTEELLGEFNPGVYYEGQFPQEIETLEYGRIEIDFRYSGGSQLSFAPLMYYGSINKNSGDDAFEETAFHLTIEIGHYNVIPFAVENLFYTISTFREPLYCRDTDFPVNIGIDYTFVIDKRPEGIILQLKKGESIINILPRAFFPDSVQMFFNDITKYIDANSGDSLNKVLMIGKGFSGFEKGIRDFNGTVSELRLYKYNLASGTARYEFQNIRNQHAVNQKLTFCVKDNFITGNQTIVIKEQFWPYKYTGLEMVPNGTVKEKEYPAIINNTKHKYIIQPEEIGFHKVYLSTIDENGNIIASTSQPFEIWVYPAEWDFEFY